MHSKFSILLVSAMSLVLFSGCMEMVYDGARLAKRETKRQAWKTLAKDGDVEAQYKLGTLYCCGERPYFNNVEALKWWCKAAKGGQRDAMFEIGKIYEGANNHTGSVIPKDDVLAYVYYSMAEKNGNKNAENQLYKLKETMSEKHINQAEVLYDRWPATICGVER